MAKQKEKTPLDKKDYTATFNLVGKVKINNNSFQIESHSQKSDWVYSRMNIGVDCGTECGTVYAQMMGGYAENRDSVIYKFLPTDSGKNETTQIAWEDRFDEELIKKIPDYQLITVGIEKDNKGKTFYRRFMSEFDAIQYLSEHLVNDSVVNVRGNISYREYNGNITMDRNITSIALSQATEDKFKATFVQTILVDDQALEEKPDKERGTVQVDAYVLEKLRTFNGWDLQSDGNKGGQLVPLRKTFEYKFPQSTPDKPDLDQKATKYLFLTKKNSVNQLTVNGMFVEQGATVEPTWEDVPDDIRELVALSIMTEDDALATCATNGNREHRCIILGPHIRNITNDDGTVTHQVQIIKGKYTSDDLDLYFMSPKDDSELDMNPSEDDTEETDTETESSDNDEQDDWLRDL